MLVRVCSQCGKSNGSDSQFCVKCGQNIAGEAIREVADAGEPVKSQPGVRVVRSNGVINDIHIPFRSVLALVVKFYFASLIVAVVSLLIYFLIMSVGVLGILASLNFR